jgi:predicted secreted protein
VITVDEHGNGSSVTLARGAELELTLPETPVTGFRWHVTRDPGPGWVAVSDTFVPATRPGASGVRVWRWRAEEPGAGELALELRRRWEERCVRSFALRVTIE